VAGGETHYLAVNEGAYGVSVVVHTAQVCQVDPCSASADRPAALVVRQIPTGASSGLQRVVQGMRFLAKVKNLAQRTQRERSFSWAR
jgi:hypothetical protein